MAQRYEDRAGRAVTRQGAMDATARLDTEAIDDLALENAVVRSAYGGTDAKNVFDIVEREIVFSYAGRVGRRGGDNEGALNVMSATNGMGAAATRAYPNNREMQRLAVRAQIRLVGASVNGVQAERGGHETGLTVQLAGLTTLPQGNTAHRNIAPGDIVVADVALPGADGLSRKNARVEPGVPKEKYRLQARPYDALEPAANLCTHTSEVLRNGALWRAAMGAAHRGTNAWLSAVKSRVDSYLIALALGVAALIDNGELVPAGTLSLRTAAPDAANASAGQRAAAQLADLTRLVHSDAATNSLDAPGRQRWALLRHALAATMLHDGSTRNFEFGYYASQSEVRRGADADTEPAATQLARYGRSGKPKMGSVYGELLVAQLNHGLRAAAAVAHAVHDDERFILGKATTGALPQSSGRFHIALGVNRP